jgi:hypothetical protein
LVDEGVGGRVGHRCGVSAAERRVCCEERRQIVGGRKRVKASASACACGDESGRCVWLKREDAKTLRSERRVGERRREWRSCDGVAGRRAL